ncbi:hypothetical protein CYMTET_45953, partial [Cymbomonas tetramitiformis]
RGETSSGTIAGLTAVAFHDSVHIGSTGWFRAKELSEGLSAGAMLTCVVAAMIPDAIKHGGYPSGFVLVIGFLTATCVKVLELRYHQQENEDSS